MFNKEVETPPSLATSLDYAAMETKATDNSGALKTKPHAYLFP